MTWQLEHEWPESRRDAVLDCLGDAISRANTAMLKEAGRVPGVKQPQRTRLRNAIGAGHVLCSLAAGTLLVLAKVKDAASVTAAQVAAAAADDLMAEVFPDAVTDLTRAAVSAVAAAGAEHLVDVLVRPEYLLALRLAGAITCPDWSTHPSNSVWTYCVQPLFAKALTDEEQAWAKKELDALKL